MKHKLAISKKWWLYTIAAFALVYMSFDCFFDLHYSMDAFNTYFGEHQNALWHIQTGRYFYLFAVYFVDYLGLNLVTDNVIWVGLFIVALTIAIIALFRKAIGLLEEGSILNEVMIFLLVSLSFVNVFLAEWFQFTEVLLMYTIAIFCVTGAAVVFPVREQEDRAPFKYFLVFLLLNIAYNNYQISITFFVFYVLCFILLESKGHITANGIKKTFVAAGLTASAFVINMGITKLLIARGVIGASSRLSTMSLDSVLANIKQLCSPDIQSYLWLNGNGMMKAPDFLVVTLVVFAATVYAIVASKRKWYDILFAAVLLGGGVCSLLLPLLISAPLYMAPRIIAPIFCVLVYMGCLISMCQATVPKRIIVLLILVALCRQSCFISTYSADIRISNACDKLWVEQVDEKIRDYEQETGIQITQIGFTNDKYLKYQWSDINYRWDVCIKGNAATWTRDYMYMYYSDRVFSYVEVPEEIQEYFANLDWGTVNLDEQMIFDEDTCYVCLF